MPLEEELPLQNGLLEPEYTDLTSPNIVLIMTVSMEAAVV